MKTIPSSVVTTPTTIAAATATIRISPTIAQPWPAVRAQHRPERPEPAEQIDSRHDQQHQAEAYRHVADRRGREIGKQQGEGGGDRASDAYPPGKDEKKDRDLADDVHQPAEHEPVPVERRIFGPQPSELGKVAGLGLGQEIAGQKPWKEDEHARDGGDQRGVASKQGDDIGPNRAVG